MSPRRPVHPEFDAVVDFFPAEGLPEFVYGLVKCTYEIGADRLVRGAVEPLYHDIRSADTRPRWSPGSDFWATKLQTDVAVRGSAYGPDGRSVRSRQIAVHVGDRSKFITVFGDRAVEWRSRGDIRFSAPAPFTEMPIVWSNAYGGWDPRTPLDEDPTTIETLARLEMDHPGMYPRNPFGKGYVVVDAPCEGIALPNLEDPAQLLTPETLVVGDPALWYRQPLPACFEFTNAFMFHRLCLLGGEAWFHPPPDAPLAEIAYGVLPPDFHALRETQEHEPMALQEGALGLIFDPLASGTPIAVEGMHPERSRVEFRVPEPPELQIRVDGEVYPASPELTNVLIEPDRARVSLTWVARQLELPRVFVPRLHAKIPVALQIDGTTIAYETPVTVHEQRRRLRGPRVS